MGTLGLWKLGTPTGRLGAWGHQQGSNGDTNYRDTGGTNQGTSETPSVRMSGTPTMGTLGMPSTGTWGHQHGDRGALTFRMAMQCDTRPLRMEEV